jgi:hypothetical protein
MLEVRRSIALALSCQSRRCHLAIDQIPKLPANPSGRLLAPWRTMESRGLEVVGHCSGWMPAGEVRRRNNNVRHFRVGYLTIFIIADGYCTGNHALSG